MMLHAVAREDFDDAIIALDRQRDNHRSLRVLQSRAVGFGNLQMIGDQIELPAGHAEGGMLVNVHARKISEGVPRFEDRR